MSRMFTAKQGNRSGASGDGDRNGRDGDASMVVLVGVRGRGKETKEEKNGFTKVAFRACSELFVELSSHREWKIRLPNGRADSQKGDEIKKSEILRESLRES
uniref:Uncharacterized protein n=1 Tax=Vespula pensylvanica TaxID=30213 RepID=A0A834K612_VESPE|nr:hypothetical protein H0235_015814 [Vespula pensylvanica]